MRLPNLSFRSEDASSVVDLDRVQNVKAGLDEVVDEAVDHAAAVYKRFPARIPVDPVVYFFVVRLIKFPVHIDRHQRAVLRAEIGGADFQNVDPVRADGRFQKPDILHADFREVPESLAYVFRRRHVRHQPRGQVADAVGRVDPRTGDVEEVAVASRHRPQAIALSVSRRSFRDIRSK